MQLWPANLTFIDSMADVEGSVTRQYETVLTLQDGWQSILEHHNVRWAIIRPRWPLANELRAQGWDVVYKDQTTVILIRR